MGGTNVVASMVVFTNGVSDRAEYRKFKTRIEQNDDYFNMHETLTRRMSEKNLKAWGIPDLLLIDGGKGQLDAALRALEERQITIPTISIAKREEEVIIHKSRSNIDTTKLAGFIREPSEGITVESSGEYYVVNLHPGQVNASSHSRNLRGGAKYSTHNDIVKLFQRIRDESHRFAVSYHTVLKRKKQTASALEEIPGVGPATRRRLIKQFGSLRGLEQAPPEQIEAIVGKQKAALIIKYLPGSEK
jgi:excinuclease ABC subunit C